MKVLIIISVLLASLFAQAANETVGTCEGEARKLVLATATQYEKSDSKKAGRAPEKLKVEKVKNTVVNAPDTFYDKYLLQAYQYSEEAREWRPATGRPSQIVFSYDFPEDEKSTSDCALSFFSYVSYSFETYDSFEEEGTLDHLKSGFAIK